MRCYGSTATQPVVTKNQFILRQSLAGAVNTGPERAPSEDGWESKSADWGIFTRKGAVETYDSLPIGNGWPGDFAEIRARAGPARMGHQARRSRSRSPPG
jgi:hypothetical protein